MEDWFQMVEIFTCASNKILCCHWSCWPLVLMGENVATLILNLWPKLGGDKKRGQEWTKARETPNFSCERKMCGNAKRELQYFWKSILRLLGKFCHSNVVFMDKSTMYYRKDGSAFF